MRFKSKDIQRRVKIELNRKVKQDGGVMTFGDNDDYPNIIEDIVAGSVTAKAAADIYARFITGEGFAEPGLNDKVVSYDNRGKQVTMIDLLRQAAESVAYYNGLYINVRLNLNRKVKDPTLFNFKHCRFSKIDGRGYTNSIGFNRNFGKNDRSYSKEQKFKAKDTTFYPVFNLKQSVFESQVQKAGGIDNYKGQVYFQFWDNRYLYPLSPFDTVYLDADTEQEMSLYKNRELRNGFMLRHILRVAEFENENEREDFVKMIADSEGGDGARLLLLEDQIDPETNEIKESGAFKVDKIESNINDKLFESWELSIANKIRKANKALPAVLIDYESSKLGNTSGEAIKQAIIYYNMMTSDDRKLMSRVFKEIFKHSADEEIANVSDWKINPLNFEKYEKKEGGLNVS